MSRCTRCGAVLTCAVADGSDAPCWCTRLPPLVAVPKTGDGADVDTGCWCEACLRAELAARQTTGAKSPG